MEDQTKTTEHLRDGNGNIIMPTNENNTGRARLIHIAAISCAFTFIFLIITCVFGVSLTNSRAANNQLAQKLTAINNIQLTNFDEQNSIILADEQNNSKIQYISSIGTAREHYGEQSEVCETCAQKTKVSYYYYEYKS